MVSLVSVVAFVVFAVSAATSQPGEGAFDDPAFGQDDEAFRFDRSQHGLQHPAERFLDPGRQAVAAVGAVGKDDSQAAKLLGASCSTKQAPS